MMHLVTIIELDHSYQAKDNHFGGTTTGVTGYNVDHNWYASTGAKDHLTSNLDRLTTHERYKGTDHVQVANGVGLSISHIGQSTISGSYHPLVLNNIRHVPRISKNLLSVNRFSHDNDTFFEFHPDFFSVKDMAMKKTLLHDRCKGGLYPLVDAHPPRRSFAYVKYSSSLWHKRLVQPAHLVVQHIINTTQVPCFLNKNVTMCDACQRAKINQPPYSSYMRVSTFP